MSAALALLTYAMVLAGVAPRMMMRGWVDRAPRAAIAIWQAIAGSVVMAIVLGAMALTFPTMRVSANLAMLLQECALALRDHYASPGGAVAAGTGAVLALAVIARLTWCIGLALMRAAAQRRRIRNTLAVLGRTGPSGQVVVVDSDTPAAYCVPGTRRRIVVTTAALDALDDAQLHAVLAHERAHLRGRHDLVIAGAAALAQAFGRVRLFRLAHDEVVRLVELLADDVAVRGSDRLTVAEALLTLGSAGPAGALSAGGSATGARVRRLIAGHRPLGRARTAACSASVAALLAAPVLVLAAPAVLAWSSHYCPPCEAVSATAVTSTAGSVPDCPNGTCASHRH